MLAVSDILRRTADETPKCGGIIARSDWAQACGRLQELVQLAETHRGKLDDAIAAAKANRSLSTELVCSRIGIAIADTVVLVSFYYAFVWGPGDEALSAGSGSDLTDSVRTVLDATCQVSSNRPFQQMRLSL
jgi:hypothetical protein